MRDFLTVTLKVPDSHIRFLTDTNAKRTNIIHAFRELQTDPRIKKDNPILIFFAGHGGETNAPYGWYSGDVDNKIQMIIPQDRNTNQKKPVHGIPDRTIGALINGIAKAKGDNIARILLTPELKLTNGKSRLSSSIAAIPALEREKEPTMK